MNQEQLQWLWNQPEWLHTIVARLTGGWRIVRHFQRAHGMWYRLERWPGNKRPRYHGVSKAEVDQ